MNWLAFAIGCVGAFLVLLVGVMLYDIYDTMDRVQRKRFAAAGLMIVLVGVIVGLVAA